MIEGAEGARVHHLRFEGLTFAHANWIQPNGGEGFIDNQANQILVGVTSPVAPTFPNAAVWLRFADHIDFVRNTVSQAGGQGIALDRGISDVTLIGNHVFDISSSGIRVGDFVTFDPTAPQVWRVTVANNHVHHVGMEFAGGVGIHILDAAQTQVVHNEVGHTPYSGISLGWGWDWVEKEGWSQWAQDNEVSWNDVHDVMQVLRDGGGIYTLGPQGSPNGGGRTYIRGNHIRSLIGLNAAGIYLDEGSAYLTVKDNVVEDLPPDDNTPWLRINGGGGHTHDIEATGNYADNTFKQIAGANLTTWPNQDGLPSWPDVVKDFIKSAGPEPAYRDVGAPRTGVNLAARGVAGASTEWSAAFSAAAAVDGRPGTGWAPSSNSAPWMIVDLGASHRLSEIELVTRQDLDQPETRRNFQIWASNLPDSSDHVVLADQGPTSLPFRSTLRVGVKYETPFRYVAVVKTVSEHVFVAELRVHGANGNLALGRPSPTSSSATLATTNATDGYAETGWRSLRPFEERPRRGKRAWFQVDLGREYQLGQIQLVMSADPNLPELRRNFQVWVIDAGGTFWPVDTQGKLPAESIWTRGVQTTVPVRYIFIIKSNTSERLGLAEVRAFGRTPNLSVGGAAGASASSCPPSLANDQSYISGWCSGAGGFWQLNMGAPRRLTGIRISELTTATSGLGQYEVWASNNSDMSLGHTVLAHQGQIVLPSPSGLFVQVSDPLPYTYVAIVHLAAGAVLGEVEVFGD
jgi:hypothetical protein